MIRKSPLEVDSRRCFAGTLVFLAGAISCSAPGVRETSQETLPASAGASISRWTPKQRERAFERFTSFEQPIGSATAGSYMIAGTTGSPAVALGGDVLRDGGSAVDAVLTAALGEVVLAAQSWVSFGGILTLVVFDPETGRVHSLDAGYAIPSRETEPLSIPSSAATGDAGRTVLVPGFFAGVAEAHARFGKLPFAALFAPAIELADEGFPLPSELAAMMSGARAATRSPDVLRLLAKEDGSSYSAGEVFAQPELAATLREIAHDGATYVSTGPWAENFVASVRAAGGKLELDDLAAYRAIWAEPVRTSYHGYEVCAAAEPCMGGVGVIEALNVLEEADLDALEDPAERMFWWIQTTQLQVISFLDRATLAALFPLGAGDEQRVGRAWAKDLWRRMQEGNLGLTRPIEAGSHSDALVAVDRSGQVAALVHSSNTGNPWATGIVVDGISIPDSASFQQSEIAKAGAGARLPDPTNPLIVLSEGRPILASASIGAGLHPHTLQRVVAVLDDARAPAEAMAVPSLDLASWDETGTATAQVPAGAFDADLLELVRALGQPIRELDSRAERAAMGYWVGIRIDPRSGALEGACPARLNGAVFGD
jgi:gamma-glutamyltranspeptidase/glutathione hydrolase